MAARSRSATAEAAALTIPQLVTLSTGQIRALSSRNIAALTTGELGVVVRPDDADVMRPIVRVFASEDGTLVPPHEIRLTAEDPDVPAVRACVDPAGLGIDVSDYL